MPKVSIITTTYKHEKFISQTIESIISQTFTDWELLIGDDSPDDNTWNIIKNYVKKYPNKIRAWHHKPNKGIVDNMNFLISLASNESKYIAFLEGDDLYTPDNLEEKLKIFEKYIDVGLVYNNVDFINDNGEITDTNFFDNVSSVFVNEKIDINNFINGKFFVSYSIMMINKIILNKINITNPIKDKLYFASDSIFFAEVGYNYKLYGNDKTLTIYRKHKDNLSKRNIKMTMDTLVFVEFLKNKYRLNKIGYRYNYLKTFVSYLNNNRQKTIYYGLMSFIYNIKNNLFSRFGMLFLSLLPNKINKSLFNKYRKTVGREQIR